MRASHRLMDLVQINRKKLTWKKYKHLYNTVLRLRSRIFDNKAVPNKVQQTN